MRARIAAALIACGFSLACAGCTHNKVQAAAPVAAAPQPATAELERPMNIAPDTSATPPPEGVAPPPAIPTAAANPPAVTIPKTKPTPAPRKPVTDQPATESAADQPAHPPAPQILPQLSPGDLEAYQRKTNEDLTVADQNLHQADGKQLSAAQKDLVEKISSFLEQSRDAVKSGDWTRAQNLAQKARLLSQELINSF
jgi:hypothetical protein